MVSSPGPPENGNDGDEDGEGDPECEATTAAPAPDDRATDRGTRPRDPDGTSGGDVSPDTAFEVLSDARRRFVLYSLGLLDGHGTIGELAVRVAAWENGTTIESTPADARERVRAVLHHDHLPRLDRLDVVAYDPVAGTVTAGDRLPAIAPYLDLARSIERDDYARFVDLVADEPDGDGRSEGAGDDDSPGESGGDDASDGRPE